MKVYVLALIRTITKILQPKLKTFNGGRTSYLENVV